MKQRQTALAVTAACVGLAVMGGTQAVSAQPAAPTPAAAFDKHFVMEAAQGNMFEIGAGRLAVQGGASAACRAARVLASDHTRAQTMLRSVSRQLSATFPRAPSPIQSWLLTQLSTAAAGGTDGDEGNSGPCGGSTGGDTAGNFNKMWFGIEVANHLQDLTMYSQAAGTTRSAALRRYICKQLPLLRGHLAMIKTAMRDSRIAVPTAAAPPRSPSACG